MTRKMKKFLVSAKNLVHSHFVYKCRIMNTLWNTNKASVIIINVIKGFSKTIRFTATVDEIPDGFICGIILFSFQWCNNIGNMILGWQ